jgi:hypothetical protein
MGHYRYSGTVCWIGNILKIVQLGLVFVQLGEFLVSLSGINYLNFLLLYEITLLGK